MTDSENAGQRATGLRLPSQIKIPSATSTSNYLQEISESQSNSRAQVSMLPGAQNGIKRSHPGVPQPDAKRKTLQERAGEYPDRRGATNSALGMSRSGAVKGTSIASLASHGSVNPPTQAGVTRQTSSYSSARHHHTKSWASSVGPGTRPPPPSISRPQTAFSKSVNGRARAQTRPRPATAMGEHGMEGQASDNGRQQNTWDVDERLSEVESQFKAMQEVVNGSLTDKKALEEAIDSAKTRAEDLEQERNELSGKNQALSTEVDELRRQVQSLNFDIEAAQRNRRFELEDKSREHRVELDQVRRELQRETENNQRDHREALDALERNHRAELENERSRTSSEIQALRAKLGTEQDDLNSIIQGKDREVQDLRGQVQGLKDDLDQEKALKNDLKTQISALTTANVTLEAQTHSLKDHISYLESDNKQQSDQFGDMQTRMDEAIAEAKLAKEKLIQEETERRVLFNKYQELKGNIRVMCRVRPRLDAAEGEVAALTFPDEKTSAQIDVTGPEEKSSLGIVTRKVTPFEFDRVFPPNIQNEDVFGEISQLVQSALDGYNVCIFCYGQTGSGKTYTMSSEDGMIPRATHMIYDTVTKLKEKSWSYTMEGSFVEVYKEELHDLLTPGRETDPKKKLEIRHDETRKTTTVTNCKSVVFDSANTVETMLAQAQNNRSVAATKANERSSRSHSVFILKLVGYNSATGEHCEGTLNLVDLAGSERLKHSGVEGDRMKETQSINKSLACLGDVIEALGKNSAHIPYRNSKLTHLLQYSLGGNSKTLMFVMVSPMEAHLKESITSLRFATKVHNTHIGTAKSTKKSKERD